MVCSFNVESPNFPKNTMSDFLYSHLSCKKQIVESISVQNGIKYMRLKFKLNRCHCEQCEHETAGGLGESGADSDA